MAFHLIQPYHFKIGSQNLSLATITGDTHEIKAPHEEERQRYHYS
jgi:hypothetical protein